MKSLPHALVLLLSFAVAACSGGTAAETATAPASAPPSSAASDSAGSSQLHLIVSGEDGVRSRIVDGKVVRDPSCMVDTIVENRGDQPLWTFTADFKPTHAQTGEPLEVVLSMKLVVPHMSSTNPLAPGARGPASKINVVGASCEQVQYTLGPVECFVPNGVCGGVSAEQTGLAGVSPIRIAASR